MCEFIKIKEEKPLFYNARLFDATILYIYETKTKGLVTLGKTNETCEQRVCLYIF